MIKRFIFSCHKNVNPGYVCLTHKNKNSFASKKDLYGNLKWKIDLLGVQRGATSDEIKKAYFLKAK